jgi:hypothetical protein
MKYSGVLLVAGVTLLLGCGSRKVPEVALQEKILTKSNPTNYQFDASVSDVKEAIKRAVEKQQHEVSEKYQNRDWKGTGDAETIRTLSITLQNSGMVELFWKGEGDSLANDVFNKPENKNDAYIRAEGSPLGESQIYFKDGKSLLYYADFHIHLVAIDANKTRVEITTYDSFILAGLDKSWSPHGPSRICVEVAPTTIEEYQILRELGEELGTKNMPPLLIPEANSQMKQIIKPRR